MDMKKSLIAFLFPLVCHSGYAQINEKADSLVTEICKSIDNYESTLDSSAVNEIFARHLEKYLSRMSTADAENAFNKIFIRLQMKCTKLVKFLKKQKPDANWVHTDECPRSRLTDKELESFFSCKSFWYIESGGDTTIVKISGNEWIDHMKDGTYSKLSLKRQSPGDFVITFIESNNKIKKNLSRPGDKYYYSVISKGSNYFMLCVSVAAMSVKSMFKIYFD